MEIMSIHNDFNAASFSSQANRAPQVVYKDGDVKRTMDIYSKMLADRVIFLDGPINDASASLINSQLLSLEADDPEKDIILYINSPGGLVTAGLAIYDTMNYIKPDVSTICTGQAASMGAVLLAAGAAGKRYSLPSSRIMIHQPLGGAQGQATNIEIFSKEINRLKVMLTEILAERSGQSFEKVTADCNRDFFLGAREANEYGLIDGIIVGRGATPVSYRPAPVALPTPSAPPAQTPPAP